MKYLKFLVLVFGMAAFVAKAERGIVVVQADGSQQEFAFEKFVRVEVGKTSVTVQGNGGAVELPYSSIDRIAIGSEVTAVTSVLQEGSFAVWPTPTTGIVNVAGASGDVAVYGLGGERFAVAECIDGAAKLDITSAPAGVYIVSAGNKSVKIIKK